MSPSLRLLVAPLLVAFSLAGACSSAGGGGTPATDAGVVADTAGGGCPSDLPTVCPTPTPSYANDVLPILQRRCYQCHADGGTISSGSGKDLGTYAEISQDKTTVLGQVYNCRMPPGTAPQLTADERTALMAWLFCGAPNN